MSRIHLRSLLSDGAGGMADHGSIYSNNSSNKLVGLSLGEASRPGLSFPLGTGLVVLIILFVSALFSFCYHWLSLKKARTATREAPILLHSGTTAESGFWAASATSAAQHQQQLLQQIALQRIPVQGAAVKKANMTKMKMVACPPVVFMAGEGMPRFIAVPCPFEATSLSPTLSQASSQGTHQQIDTPTSSTNDDSAKKLNIAP
ncbi:hypothetical protein KP509_24G079500 [Ceratopteris richardii]|uniref:Uncharacterized protein n=1 Tax=Ceratopteris richardii TaxID=49495 RepID=A0A8T2RW50_CERRI|nr:hypothetical protein KP509_24G079500 [Ceratopteris richardii]